MLLASLGSARINTHPGALGSRDKGAWVPAPFGLHPTSLHEESPGQALKKKDIGHWALSAGHSPVYDPTRYPPTMDMLGLPLMKLLPKSLMPAMDSGPTVSRGGALIIRISIYTVTKNTTTVIIKQRQASRVTKHRPVKGK